MIIVVPSVSRQLVLLAAAMILLLGPAGARADVADAAAPPVITSATSVRVGVIGPFGYQITATNNPTSFGATGLPQGLSFDASSGFISGFLPAAGTYTLNVSATNDGGTGSAVVTLTYPGVPRVSFAMPGSDGDAKGTALRGGAPLKVKFVRSGGDISQSLEVFYLTQGSAVAMEDYKALSGTVTIPAGATSASIKVRALADGEQDENKTLRMILLPIPAGTYDPVEPRRTKIRIRKGG